MEYVVSKMMHGECARWWRKKEADIANEEEIPNLLSNSWTTSKQWCKK